MAVFWDVVPCSLVEIYGRLKGACCLHYQGTLTSVNFYQTTRRNIPEGSYLHTRRRENLKSHQLFHLLQFKKVFSPTCTIALYL
jgi:hypothetical protein